VLAPGGPAELTRGYRYTPPGWLASVSDRYLTETIDYITGGPDGAGYHDGRAARVTTSFTGVRQDGFVSDFDYRYGYDALGRLAAADNSVGEEFGLSGLDYDANGNLIARTVGGVAQRLRYRDGTNRLHAIDDGVETDPFGYDRDGNVADAPPLGVSDLRYEPLSELPAGLRSAAGALHLEHDAAGALLYRAGPDGQRLYVPGDAAPLALHHIDASGGHRVGYLIPGPRGAVAVWSPQGTAYVLRGRLGSTRAVHDGTGLIGAFNYLPDGGFLGTPLDECASTVYPYLFTGAERDPVTGLYLFPQRVYDPVTGRFLSTDPVGQYPSLYLYAGGDPVNGYDPSGGFAWSWEAFGAVVGGIVAIVGGIVLTVLTAGAATAIMIGAAMVGGALIGAGIASAAYGFGHADASKQNFDWAEWGIMVGLGAAFGAAAAGLGFVPAALSTSTAVAFGVETFIGTGLGALDGFVTNGSLNAYHTRDFLEGAGSSAGWGALGGFVGGAVGGTLGRGPMLRTNRTVRAGRSAADAERGEMHVVSYRKEYPGRPNGHVLVGTKTPAAGLQKTHLTLENAETAVKSADYLLTPDPRAANKRVWTAVDVPAPNAARARDFAQARVASAERPPYSYLNNNCTTYAQSVLREAGIYPPLWTHGPVPLRFWMRTIGSRVAE
jgi:RHS repeat-associated protein